MNILPGEPVPPGFEDEINRVAEIQQAIDQYKGNALVGLEYTIELYEEDREPGYICLLCDKRGDPRTIMQHWTSFNHRIKYLEKHFPSAVREFNPVKYKPNSHSIMIMIVQSLAEAIEDHHGRLTLAVCNVDEFRRDRSRIQQEINEKFHIDERNGPNFLNVIDRSLWESKKQAPNKPTDQTLQSTLKPQKRTIEERPSNREELDEISSEDETAGAHDTNKKSKLRTQSPAYRILPRVRRSPPFEENRENANDKKLPTPKELSLQASHIAQERYKWEKYRCMLEIQLKQMEKIQKDYEKNPEKHPLYPEEWKKFWNRRYKELQAEKKTDPNKYDYKPEWIQFWTKRMQDLFKDEVDKKKKEIKVKLGLPENAEEKVDQLKEKYKVQVSRNVAGNESGAPVMERSKNYLTNNPKTPAMTVIDISDDDSNDSSPGKSTSRKPRRSRSVSPRPRRHESKRSRHRSNSRSRSPRSDDYGGDRRYYKQRETYERHIHSGALPLRPYPGGEYYGVPPSFSRSRYQVPPHYSGPVSSYRVLDSHQYPKYERSPSPSINAKEEITAKAEPSPEDDGPLTVVAVLRLLTALEEHLGSLGPKVVDMLGKALALEKVKANSADDMLINEDNCVFFETIKEKLKGLLIADVLDEAHKVRAVKRAVRNIAAIVHQVNEKGKTAANCSDKGETKDEDDMANKKKHNPTPKIEDLPFDRQLISTKLAAALVMQGREDVTTEDMDKLIYIFILMIKLTKEKPENDDAAIYTKDILPGLGIAIPTPPAPVVTNLTSAIPSLVDEFFENEVNALVQEVEEDMSSDANEKSTKGDTANSNMLESLTDSDLQTLLQNFKHLSSEEQHHLIAHLKKLETADPIRVEKLRKFVNISDLSDAATTSTSLVTQSKNNDDSNRSNDRHSSLKHYEDSPVLDHDNDRVKYSMDEVGERRARGVSVSNPNKFSLDDEDEDDDYNFEDVFKAASSNVKGLSDERLRQSKTETKSVDTSASNGDTIPTIPIPSSSTSNSLTFNPAGLNISLSDTQNLIANLMGSLQQSNSNTPPIGNPIKNIASKPQNQQLQQLQQHQQQQHNALPQNNMNFYQQQQQQHGPAQGYPEFNQMGNMNNPQATGYYNNSVGGCYNNAVGGAAYPGYQPQQWGGAQGMQQQPYGLQNFMTPQQQQQMGYNMYGRGGN